MKIIFVSQIVPYPPHGGASQRIFNLLRELGRENEVTLLAYIHPEALQSADDLEVSRQVIGEFCSRMEYFPMWSKKSPLHKFLAVALGFLYSKPFSVLGYRSKALERRLRELVTDGRPDIVQLDTIAFAPLKKMVGNVPCVLTHHNIESALMARRAKYEATVLARYYIDLQARRLEHYEREQVQQFALNIMVSAVDAEQLQRIYPGANTIVVENGVDVDYFQPVRGQEQPALIFTGGMNMFANRDAVMWFLDEMWPQLKQRVPELRFYAIGQAPPSELLEMAAADPSIEVPGFVDDVRPWVAKSAVYVVPLRVGGGTRLKVVDAMAQGKAIVSTSVGCEGLHVTDGKEILIAYEPEAFIDHVLALLGDESRRNALGDASRALVEAQYAWPSLGAKLLEGYRKVIEATPGSD
jgi:glycosyltransferase involved in cell wall biosynthesis